MDMKNKLIIFGNSSYANMAYDYFNEFSDYQVVAFTVNKKYKQSNTHRGLPLIAYEELDNFISCEDYDLFIAVGSSKLNATRENIYKEAKLKGITFATFIHPHAYLAPHVTIGENCMIMECSRILRGTRIGNNAIVWPSAFVSHDNHIGDNCYIVGSTNGFCSIGKNCYIGSGAVIGDKVKIADYNLIAMGAVVRSNTDTNSIYEGNPAKKRRGVSATRFAQLKM